LSFLSLIIDQSFDINWRFQIYLSLLMEDIYIGQYFPHIDPGGYNIFKFPFKESSSFVNTPTALMHCIHAHQTNMIHLYQAVYRAQLHSMTLVHALSNNQSF